MNLNISICSAYSFLVYLDGTGVSRVDKYRKNVIYQINMRMSNIIVSNSRKCRNLMNSKFHSLSCGHILYSHYQLLPFYWSYLYCCICDAFIWSHIMISKYFITWLYFWPTACCRNEKKIGNGKSEIRNYAVDRLCALL